jgi:tRNA G26 N,N-dimethylase Trm1
MTAYRPVGFALLGRHSRRPAVIDLDPFGTTCPMMK